MQRKILSEYWQEALSEIKERAERGEPEFPTGLDFLDKVTDGIHKGELWIVSGKPRSGKTVLALQMAESFAQKSEHTVNYFSLEMKGAELVLRMFSAMNNLDSEGLRDGSYIKEMENGSQKFMDYLSTIDLEISEFKGYRFEEIVSVMEKHYDEKKPDIIFIDFVQMIDKSESETEKMALDSYMRKLKELAKKHSMGVVIVSQLRRLPSGADYNREPEITDLLGSGGLEQIADKVILLYRVIQENQDIKYYLNLAKNRQGREIKQEVIFDGAHSRFKEIELSPMERKVKQEFSGQQI